MPSAEKQQRITRLSGSVGQRPVPAWPKLPNFIRERHPDKIEEIEAYEAAVIDFFKKAGVIANS